MIRFQFLRFGMTGLINTAVSFAAFNLLFHSLASVPRAAMISQSVAYSLGILTSFFLNRLWTFRKGSAGIAVQLLPFLALQLLLLGGSSLALGLLVDLGGWPPNAVWVTVMALVTVLNFFGQKFLVFR